MLNWVFGGRRDSARAKNEVVPSYEEAKTITATGDAEARRKLASVSQLQPEFLYYFASDEAPEVRRAVANNEGTPIQADLLLARDPDEFVKVDLAKKVGRILPTLSADQSRKVADMVYEVVDVLSQDSLPQVRAMISEQVRGLDTVPPRIIQRLARDTDAIVSTPVLEFSPLLSDKDLIDIVLTGCRGAALAAVARRDQLGSEVGNTIAATEDEQGVLALLNNATASLSNDTLTAIVDAAADRPGWQDALVGRDGLTADLMRRMGRYLSESALNKLIENNVLVDEVLENELRTGVAAKIAEQETLDDAKAAEEEQDVDRARAEALHARGELTAIELCAAAEKEQREFLVHALALLSNADSAITRKLITAKDPKLAVSIAWHCKLGMKFAVMFQRNIMGLPDKSILDALDGDTGFPMDEDDMAWSLEVLGIA